ncbi:MAG: M42 family metallopeptidase, partial [Clostridium sp.]
MNINREFILNAAKEILEFDSPTGFCGDIIDKIEDMIKGYGYNFERTNKGCGIITIEGNSNDKTVGL